MEELPVPSLRMKDETALIGTTAIYSSQAEASRGIPEQWREFRRKHPELGGDAPFHGASPCTPDRKIHYLTGVCESAWRGEDRGERLILVAGEYAVLRVDDAVLLRDAWIWMLGDWLPGSGRREKNAPELERFSGISEDGLSVGPVEIWIPLEPPVNES